MRIITLSREFGSGGRELGRRLARLLGYAYYDKEIVTAIAEGKGLDVRYVEGALESDGPETLPLTFHNSFTMSYTMGNVQTDLLLEQKKVIENIAKAGKDCVIVGRNADVILKDYDPFSIFVCAEHEDKIQRCIDRAPEGENLTRREIEQNMRRIDKNRSRTREIIADGKWGDAASYHMTVNTTGWNLDDLTKALAGFATSWFERQK